MRALVKFLRQHAIAVVIYLDDLAFVVEGSRAAALRARDFVDRTLHQAGLTRHLTKDQFAEPSKVLHIAAIARAWLFVDMYALALVTLVTLVTLVSHC